MHDRGGGGDFNLNQDLDLDREGGTMKTTCKRSCALVERLRNYFDLIDIWRVRNKTKKRFTWRRYIPYVQSRLDFWLISESVQSDIMENDIIPCVLSDNDYVTLHLQIKKQKIGPHIGNSIIAC